jgi:hypothetical protein
MLTFGIVFEPLGADDEEEEDAQPAAIRLAAVARPTQATLRECGNVPPPSERERRPPLPLLPNRITHAPFTRRQTNKRTVEDI